MNVILFGFKASGKTHFGKRLSVLLKRSFVDLDDLIVDLYKKETGQVLSIRKIYEALGEKAFRLLEKKAIAELSQKSQAIISLGGGAILDPSSVAILQKIGLLIYLKVSFEVAKRRILQNGVPSFADKKTPIESLYKVYLDRIPVYEAIRAPSIDTDLDDEEEIVKQLSIIIYLRTGSHGI